MTRPPQLSRRTLLIGGAGTLGALALAAACGTDSGGGGEESSGTTAGDDTLNLLSVFAAQGPFVASGGEQRITYALADFEGVPIDGPEAIPFRLVPDAGGAPIEIEARRHDEGIPTPYYPLRAEFATEGIWTATAEVEGQTLEASFSVAPAADVPVLQRGAAAPATETPTAAAPQGVDPICTADPVCDLHEVTLAGALTEGSPIALLVATPAYCSTTVCGPVLDVVLAVREELPDVRYLHAEVYKDPLVVDNIAQATPAQITGDLGLTYEPSLFLFDGDGLLVDRLDNIFDTSEVRQAVSALAGGS